MGVLDWVLLLVFINLVASLFVLLKLDRLERILKGTKKDK